MIDYMGATLGVSLRQLRRQPGGAPGRPVPRPDAALPARRADSEDEFRPLRLENGLYIQKHAPMLRVAIPYGLVSVDAAPDARPHFAASMTEATAISRRARTFSSTGRGSKTCPTFSRLLATVEMHAIQTSGNCVRNTTTDPFAGVARRRDRRPSPVGRARPPMVDGPPGIRFPSAQVQDRRHRGDRRPDRGAGARHRRASRARRAWTDRIPHHGRGRPRPNADDRTRRSASSCLRPKSSTTSTRSCASTTSTAGATTNTRPGSRSW